MHGPVRAIGADRQLPSTETGGGADRSGNPDEAVFPALPFRAPDGGAVNEEARRSRATGCTVVTALSAVARLERGSGRLPVAHRSRAPIPSRCPSREG